MADRPDLSNFPEVLQSFPTFEGELAANESVSPILIYSLLIFLL